MKFIFMLLIFFVLMDPAMAKPATNTAECLKTYQSYLSEFGSSALIPENKMLRFIGHCLPDKTSKNAINNTNKHQLQAQPYFQQNTNARIKLIKT